MGILQSSPPPPAPRLLGQVCFKRSTSKTNYTFLLSSLQEACSQDILHHSLFHSWSVSTEKPYIAIGKKRSFHIKYLQKMQPCTKVLTEVHTKGKKTNKQKLSQPLRRKDQSPSLPKLSFIQLDRWRKCYTHLYAKLKTKVLSQLRSGWAAIQSHNRELLVKEGLPQECTWSYLSTWKCSTSSITTTTCMTARGGGKQGEMRRGTMKTAEWRSHSKVG